MEFQRTLAHIFHDPASAADILRRPPDVLDRFCTLLDERLAKFHDTNSDVFHLWHLMPPPSYEYACGLRIAAPNSYLPPFALKPDCGVVLRFGKQSRAVISVAGLTMTVESLSGGRYSVSVGDTKAETKGPYLRISCRDWGDRYHFGINGKPFVELAPTDLSQPDRIIAEKGTVHLVSLQTLAGKGNFLSFNPQQPDNDDIVSFRDDRVPFRFEWGLRTLRLCRTVTALAIARDLAAAIRQRPQSADPAYGRQYERIVALTEHLATVAPFLQHYMKWPLWHPGTGNYPEAGGWHRNSFSNGTIPYLVALLARLLERADDPDVIADFHDKGTSFLNSAFRAGFMRDKARDLDRWIDRSANHGISMLLSYVAGAKLIGQENREDIRDIHRMLGLLLHRHLEDGSFCEGVGYNYFALMNFLPYRQLYGDYQYDDTHSIGTLSPLLARNYDWTSLSMDGEGRVFANFGDNFVERITHPSQLAFSQQQASGKLDIPASYREDVDTYFSLAPPLDTGRIASRRIESRLYPENRFFLSAALDEAGHRQSGLFVIGSRIQLTHNRNHDCGGFAFYMGEARVDIASSRRAPQYNNTIGLLQRGELVGDFSRRTYDGAVSVEAEDDEHCIVRTEAVFDRSLSPRHPFVCLRRTFTHRPFAAVKLIVRTVIEHDRTFSIAGLRQGRIEPCLSLNLTGFATEPGSGAWVTCLGRNGETWTDLAPQHRDDCTIYAQAGQSKAPLTEFVTLFGTDPLKRDALLAIADSA